jgi:hypothetical protein
MVPVVYWSNMMSLHFIVLAHCMNSLQVVQKHYPNGSTILLLDAACLAEEWQIPIL